MIRPDLLASKLSRIEDRTKRVVAHRKATVAELAADRDALELVAFNLMLAIHSAVDLAQSIITDARWSPARGLADAFHRLAEQGVLSPHLARAMMKATGLRNVIAHGYADIDVEKVHSGSFQGIEDLGAFVREIAAWERTKRSA